MQLQTIHVMNTDTWEVSYWWTCESYIFEYGISIACLLWTSCTVRTRWDCRVNVGAGFSRYSSSSIRCAVFYKVLAVLSYSELRGENVFNARNTLYHQSKENFQEECTKELVGSIVITRYNNRTYRVDDIKWNISPKDTFTLMDGTKTTFVEYYRWQWSITSAKEKITLPFCVLW